MDLDHVPGELGGPMMFLQMCRANAERANRDKGRTPRDHPPPFLLIYEFMMMRNDAILEQHKSHISTSQIPAPYHPCTLPAAKLRPIRISQMGLETHHRGRRVVVRVLTPTNRFNAIMAIVEDEEGTALLLQLYNQPDEEVIPATQTLQTGRHYLIKDPFFKRTTSDNSYSLRVDHVSDIALLDEDDDLLPAEWKSHRTVFETSHDIRMQGNVAVGLKSWAEAEQLYTSALQVATTAQDEQLALLNRSLASLKLERPARALTDAVQAGSGGNTEPTEKVLFRKASALYNLAKFDQCLEILQALEDAYPSSEAAKPLMTRVRERLHEQQTGEYDFRSMYKQARTTPPLIDCATYTAPVQVLESPGRGRGLFTTRKVLAGDLLICEKAFGYKYVDEDSHGHLKILMNTSTQRMTMGGQADLLTQVVQKLYHDPEAARSFSDLYHGDYKPVTASTVDGRPVVDTFLVERVISLTSFGAPRTTLSNTEILPSKRSAQKTSEFHTCGLWSLASHINHSCMSNCRRSFIGDMQIVRATRDIEAGEELFFWYQCPQTYEAYNETKARFRHWGFTCDCALCLDRKSTSRDVLLKRKTLAKDLKRAFEAKASVSKAQRLVEQLAQTYPVAAKKPGGVRLELWDIYVALGRILLDNENPKEAIKFMLKGLEALGFIFTADTEGSQGLEQLQIKQWGIATDSTMQIFLMLSDAYQKVSPASSAAAKRYMQVAYTMVIGEKETFADWYPGL